MKSAPVLALVVLLAGCASRFAGATDDELVREMVTIRPFDGHTGFGTLEGPRSYGWEAKQVLVERKAAAVPALTSALDDPTLDATQKSIVRDAIGDLGMHARTAVPKLVEELKTTDTRTAWRICHALQRIGPAAGAAVPDLLSVLRERGDEIVTPQLVIGDVVVPPNRLRTIVAYTLGAMRQCGEPALPALVEGAVQTDDVAFRQACRRAMRDILGPEPPYRP